MTALDGTVSSVYIILMIGLSVFIGRRQSDQDDYFVGGRNLSRWSVGISIMATQTSAISFMAIPAFVALNPGGGLGFYFLHMPTILALCRVDTVMPAYLSTQTSTQRVRCGRRARGNDG